MEHPVRQLAKTANGLSCIALCAALSSLSNLEPGAMVLNMLVDIHHAPQALRPSLQQWGALLKACSGMLAVTKFECVTHHNMHLFGTRMRHVGRPREVAEALNAISKLSRGLLTSITLVGNATCGWLAAFGNYFFGLDVEIHLADGTMLFRTIAEGLPVQISVTYGDADDAVACQISSTTYLVHDLNDLLSTVHPLFQGRIAWHEVIQTRFGSAGRCLLNTGKTFSKLLGSAARIFAAVSKADPGVKDLMKPREKSLFSYENWIGYTDNSFGHGLIQFAVAKLPELAPLKSTMESYLECSLSQAFENYEIASINLTKVCSCSTCDINNAEEELDLLDICVYRLAESIIIIVWNLSLVDIEKSIQPTHLGLWQVYDSWACKGHEFIPKAIGDVGMLLDYLQIGTLHQVVQFLFTGFRRNGLDLLRGHVREADTRVYSEAAFTSLGFCFIQSALLNLSDRPDHHRHLAVLPGVIELQSGVQYEVVTDGHSIIEEYSAGDYQELISTTPSRSTSASALKLELLVKETMHELLVSFRFSSPKGGIGLIGPALLSRALLHSVGRVYCPRRACQVLTPPYGGIVSVDGEGAVDYKDDFRAGRSIVVRPLGGHVLGRCLGTYTSTTSSMRLESPPILKSNVILRLDECLSCCIRAARLLDKDVVYIVT